MFDYSNFSLGRKKDKLIIDINSIKGGIKTDTIDEKLYRAFKETINSDGDNIIDKEEIDSFVSEIKVCAKDNNFSLAEAAKFLNSKNLKNVKPQQLYKFLENIYQASENIKESYVINDQSGKTIFIQYMDDSEETIYPDKTSKVEFVGSDEEKIIQKFDGNHKKISENVQYKDKSRKTIKFENELPLEEIFEKDGQQTSIIYENGLKKSKEVQIGENIYKYAYINGEEKEVYSKCTKGSSRIEKSFVYNNHGLVVRFVEKKDHLKFNEGKVSITTNDYFPNGKISTVTTDADFVTNVSTSKSHTVLTFDETGKKKHLARRNEHKFKDNAPRVNHYEINYDKNGNVVGYVPEGFTLQKVLKRLEIKEGSETYKKFIELNKNSITSYNNGKVKGFDVGAPIIIPGELDDDNILFFVSIDPIAEKDSYERVNIGQYNISGIAIEPYMVEKNTTLWELARQTLVNAGNTNPTKAQIAEQMDIIATINHILHIDEPIKKGFQIMIPLKASETLPDELKMSTYRIENIRKKYPADKYQIKRERTNPQTDEYGCKNKPVYTYHVIDKRTQKEVIAVIQKDPETGAYPNEIRVEYYNNKGAYREINFAFDGVVMDTLRLKDRTLKYVYDKQGTLETYEKETPDGQRVVICKPKSPEKIITITGKNDEFKQIKYKKGKIYSVGQKCINRYYNPDGSDSFVLTWDVGGKNLQVDYPKTKDFKDALKAGDSSVARKIVNTLNKDNYEKFFLVYSRDFEKDLIADISKSKLDENTKTELTNKIRKLVNDNIPISNAVRITTAKGPEYKSDKYKIHYDKAQDIVTVTNLRTNKVSKIVLNKLLSDCNSFEKAKLTKSIVEGLPGEVLEDLAIEIRKIKVDFIDYDNSKGFHVVGNYSHSSEFININRNDFYEITLTGLATEARGKKYLKNIFEVLVHEIGHSVDYTGYFKNTNSSAVGKFHEVFQHELEKYKQSGKVQWNSEDENFRVEKKSQFSEDTGEYKTDMNTTYATKEEREMFAECYTLMMLGNCHSKDHIMKYFPETYKAAKELLAEIRQSSVYKRQSRLHDII